MTKNDKIVKLLALEGGKQAAWDGAYMSLKEMDLPLNAQLYTTALIDTMWDEMYARQIAATDNEYTEAEIDILLRVYENDTLRGILLRGTKVATQATTGIQQEIMKHQDQIATRYEKLILNSDTRLN
jgi:hypothetical protein